MKDEEKSENKHSGDNKETQEDHQDDKEEEDLHDKRESGNEAEEETLVPEDVIEDHEDQGGSDEFLRADEVCIVRYDFMVRNGYKCLYLQGFTY